MLIDKKKEIKMKNSKAIKILFVAMFALVLIAGVNSAYASEGKPIILKYAVWTPSPDVNVFSKANSWMVREFEKLSKGRIKIEYYWSGSLIPAKKIATGLKSGVADIANVIPDYSPGQFPLLMVGSLPGISHDYWTTAIATRDLAKMPEIQAELDKQNIMYLGNVNNITFGYWTKVPIRKISELKGMKIVAVGQRAKLVEALGSVPVSIISTEIYPALDKGTADGAIANPGYASDYRWEEVCPWYFDVRLGNNGGMFLGINKDSWKRIPPDLQKLFLSLQDAAYKKAHIIYQGNAEEKLRKHIEAGVVTSSRPTKADRELLLKTAQEVLWEKWANNLEKKGLPGRKVLNRWVELNKKYDAIYPFR